MTEKKEPGCSCSVERHAELIDLRLSSGLEVLRKYYTVEACVSDPLIENPVIGGITHNAKRYDIKNVGNLLTMAAKGEGNYQLSSFVIMPYKKNLPLFSTDFVYTGETRYFLFEIYDLSVRHDALYDAGIRAFSEFGPKLEGLKEIPTKPCWYDDIRPVCFSRAPRPEQDETAIKRFLEFLELFVKMEQEAPPLSREELQEKWQKNREYADRLIDEGGVSTDLFTAALGAENTRRFFHELFFGSDWYRLC